MAMLIHLCIMENCFCPTKAELNSRDWDHMTFKPKIFIYASYRKLANLWSEA